MSRHGFARFNPTSLPLLRLARSSVRKGWQNPVRKARNASFPDPLAKGGGSRVVRNQARPACAGRVVRLRAMRPGRACCAVDFAPRREGRRPLVLLGGSPIDGLRVIFLRPLGSGRRGGPDRRQRCRSCGVAGAWLGVIFLFQARRRLRRRAASVRGAPSGAPRRGPGAGPWPCLGGPGAAAPGPGPGAAPLAGPGQRPGCRRRRRPGLRSAPRFSLGVRDRGRGWPGAPRRRLWAARCPREKASPRKRGGAIRRPRRHARSGRPSAPRPWRACARV
jgi:hypothetical protein